GGDTEAMIEHHPFAHHPVEGGSADDLVAVDRGVRPGPVVRQGEQDVWPLGRSRLRGRQQGGESETEDKRPEDAVHGEASWCCEPLTPLEWLVRARVSLPWWWAFCLIPK